MQDRLKASEARAAAAVSKAIVLEGQLESFRKYMEAKAGGGKGGKKKKKGRK